MYSDGLLKLPIFTIQKNFKILLTVYSLSPQDKRRAENAHLLIPQINYLNKNHHPVPGQMAALAFHHCL